MRNASSDVDLDQHIEATKAHHAQNSDDERRYHQFVVDKLGLAGAAKQHLVQEHAASVVAHLIKNPNVLAGISGKDDRTQVEELKRIREEENSGPSQDPGSSTEASNAATNSYLNLRNALIRSGERNVNQRERRATLRR